MTTIARFFAYASLWQSVTLAANQLHGRQDDAPEDPLEFDWSSISPSTELQYHECYNGERCARLKVPMDWASEGDSGEDVNGNYVAIAITSIPATVSPSDPKFGGSVMFNAGGPGGAAAAATPLGHYLKDILDSGGKDYEVILFDPRGVGLTTPPARCYSSEFKAVSAMLRSESLPSLEASNVSSLGLEHRFQMAAGLGDVCAEAYGRDGGEILAHVSSASVARDMVAIADAIEEERADGEGNATTTSEQARVNFIGVSYGTLVGNMFASMFPGRVGKLYLDGVVDPDNWMYGNWTDGLHDIEDTLDYMYTLCYEDEGCDLRRDSDSGPADIRRRVSAFLDDLLEKPAYRISEDGPHLVTSDTVRVWLQSRTYQPDLSWESMASILNEAMTSGNFTQMAPPDSLHGQACDISLPEDEHTPNPLYTWHLDVSTAIACGDAYAPSSGPWPRDISWAEEVVDENMRQSPTLGAAWAQYPLYCVNWQIENPYRFDGEFGSPEAVEDGTDENAPATQILWASARTDNATPLRNALAASAAHKGSSVVIQEGHTHVAALDMTQCLLDVVNNFFDDGVLPSNGTVCDSPREVGAVFRFSLDTFSPIESDA